MRTRSIIFSVVICVLGLVTVGLSLVQTVELMTAPGFIALCAISFLVGPRMSFYVPRSKFILNFSDSMIFLGFLMYGSQAAVLVACLDAVSNYLHLKRKGVVFSGLSVPFNIASSVLATGASVVFTSLLMARITDGVLHSTPNLLSTLGTLAFFQFLLISTLVSIYYAFGSDRSFLDVWKSDLFVTSLTHFSGAGLAGIIFKLLNDADYASIAISLIILAVVYFAYRHIIGEMTRSIEQAELAERAKADAEREKRVEVEQYAEELSHALKKEEDTGRELRRSRRNFQHAALHDALTKLPNRSNFGAHLIKQIEQNKHISEDCGFVLFLDIARFKTINDSLGHTVGDKVLTLIARRFQRLLPDDAVIARLGGDEFAVILKDCRDSGRAEELAWTIQQKLSRAFAVSGNRVNIQLNIGIAPIVRECETPEDVLRDADIAMHHAKEKTSGVELFTPDMRDKFLVRARIEAELPSAIERGELAMHYQPLISLKDGSLIGFEALLRWFHPTRGFISPAEFIPVAEETGQIIPITTWILRETCQQLARWQKLSERSRQLIVSVNISGKHLSYQSLLVDVEMALETARLRPASLKLEITESAAMANAEQTIRMLSHLKSLGVQLSIDDFGTGYSSLSYLHRLPVDTLKIDRSFVNTVGDNEEESAILKTIIALAKNLRLRVIAEGIEEITQLDYLRSAGCDYGQGYLMSKPLPPEVIEELITTRESWFPATYDITAETKPLAANELLAGY